MAGSVYPFVIPNSTIRWTHIYVVNHEEGERPIYYCEGYCSSSDISKLPTEQISNGSNVINTDNGDWHFFKESNESWGVMTNIHTEGE